MQSFINLKSKKIVVFAITAMMLLAFLFYAFLISHEVNHHHEDERFHDDCPICKTLEQCEAIIHQLSSALAISVTVVFASVLFVLSVVFVSRDAVEDTLVSKKIRLND